MGSFGHDFLLFEETVAFKIISYPRVVMYCSASILEDDIIQCRHLRNSLHLVPNSF